MQYSIVIPVFNQAGFPDCSLESLQATLPTDIEGEIVVADDAARTGFAAAVNQAARNARGRFLVILDSAAVLHPGWLEAMLEQAAAPGVGAVGARGAVVFSERFGTPGFVPVAIEHAETPQDVQIVTSTCLVSPRELFLRHGGFDERFRNGCEDVDYSLRLGALGFRVVQLPGVLAGMRATPAEAPPVSVSWNVSELAHRWNGNVSFDANRRAVANGLVSRLLRTPRGQVQRSTLPTPPVTVFVHGMDRSGDPVFLASLRDNAVQPASIVSAASTEAISKAREAMDVRGDRYLAFVDARCDLRSGWLDELIRQIEYAPNTGAAAYAPELPLGEDEAVFAADARCSLLQLSQFPQHLRLGDFPTLDGAVADLTIRALDARTGTRCAGFGLGDVPPASSDERFESLHGLPVAQAISSGREAIEAAFRRTPGRRAGLVSIVMLSWNAPQFTKLALESIEQYTTGEYEVIIVDNGSGPETVAWLETLGERARIIFNAENRGFAGGNNQAFAAARGEYVVMLNNDVIVTEGWLEGLLHAFDRIPGLGVSAPRSNKIAGDQIVVDASYADIAQMHVYANGRRERYRDQGYMTDRAIGLCLCIDRRVIGEIGGIDERFGVGNFEDDDFCMRVRAAGYRIFVCDDVFIHHFGSQTFAANNIDWTATMRENWTKFASKWDLPAKQENGGYVPALAIRRGYDRGRHYVALPAQPQSDAQTVRAYEAVFFTAVHADADWDDTGAFVRRYLRAFSADRSVLLAIAATGEPDATAIGERIRRLAQREGIDLDAAPDIDVCDTDDESAWRDSLTAKQKIAVSELSERSPSALRRMLEPEAAR